jgi:hypothetical protein
MCPLDLAVSALWTWIYGLHQRLLYGTAVRLGARPCPYGCRYWSALLCRNGRDLARTPLPRGRRTVGSTL